MHLNSFNRLAVGGVMQLNYTRSWQWSMTHMCQTSSNQTQIHKPGATISDSQKSSTRKILASTPFPTESSTSGMTSQAKLSNRPKYISLKGASTNSWRTRILSRTTLQKYSSERTPEVTSLMMKNQLKIWCYRPTQAHASPFLQGHDMCGPQISNLHT